VIGYAYRRTRHKSFAKPIHFEHCPFGNLVREQCVRGAQDLLRHVTCSCCLLRLCIAPHSVILHPSPHTSHLTPHTSQGMVWRAAVHLTNTHHTRTLEIHQTHDRHAAESSRWQGILMPCSCRPCSCLALTHLAVQHGRVPKGRGANGCVNGRLRLMWPCLLLLPAQSGGNRGLLSCRMLLGTNVLGRILTARLQTARLELSQDQLPKRNMRTTSHNQSFKD